MLFLRKREREGEMILFLGKLFLRKLFLSPLSEEAPAERGWSIDGGMMLLLRKLSLRGAAEWRER